MSLSASSGVLSPPVYCGLDGTCQKCCDDRPWQCVNGVMCQLPTPECPTMVCDATGGHGTCPVCGNYSIADWAVSYSSSGVNSADGKADEAWTPPTDHAFSSATPKPTGTWARCKGSITVIFTYTATVDPLHPLPPCVNASLFTKAVSSSAGVVNNGFASDGAGDPGIPQYDTFGNIVAWISQGTHVINLAVDTDPLSAQYKTARITFSLESYATSILNCFATAEVDGQVLAP